MKKKLTLYEAWVIFLKHPSPFVLFIICLSFISFRLVGLAASLSWQEGGVALGVMIYWPFQEWWMHRILLHLKPISLFGREFEPSFARLHRLHHENPKDIPLSFLPLSMILSSLVAFTSLAYYLTSSWAWTCVFMGAASLSTLLYEWVHYLTHTPYIPKGSYYRKIWKLHRWHHYKNEKYWYSFTVPWIDEWFGTGPDFKTVPHSPTAHSLRAPSSHSHSSQSTSSSVNTPPSSSTSSLSEKTDQEIL